MNRRNAGERIQIGRVGRHAADSSTGSVFLAPLRCLYTHRHAIRRFTIKEIQERYRSTFLGLFWFVLTPFLYLAAFAVVFGYIIPGREAAWEHLDAGELGFVLAIFSGLVIFWLFAKVLAGSGNLIPRNAYLVREVLFPTEVLPWVATFTGLFEFGIHLVYFLLAYTLLQGALPGTILALPTILLPFVLLITGLAWILAGIGALVRDIGQLVQVGVTAMLFMSGVFFPAEQVPEAVRPYFLLNPLARTIEDFRGLTFAAELPSFFALAIYTVLAYALMVLGYAWFKRLQPRFSENL